MINAALLRDITGKQHGLSKDLASFKDNLDVLWEKANQSQTQDVQVLVPMNDQQDTLDAIISEIGLVREELTAGKTNAGEPTEAEPATTSSFASTLTITSELFALMLSGTMIVSAHTLASQARDLSAIARNFELHVPPTEHLAEQRSVGTGGTNRKAENLRESRSSATIDAIDFERPATGPDARMYEVDLNKKPVTASCRLQEDRASESQETRTQDKLADKQHSTSCLTHINTKIAEQSESCPDQLFWDRIWNSSMALPVQRESLADEKGLPDVDCSVRQPRSSTSPQRNQSPTQKQRPSDSSPSVCSRCHITSRERIFATTSVCSVCQITSRERNLEPRPMTHSPSWSTGYTGGARSGYRYSSARGRASKLSLSKSNSCIEDDFLGPRSTLGNRRERKPLSAYSIHSSTSDWSYIK